MSPVSFLGLNGVSGMKLGFAAGKTGSKLRQRYSGFWDIPPSRLLAGEIPKTPLFHSQKCLSLVDKL